MSYYQNSFAGCNIPLSSYYSPAGYNWLTDTYYRPGGYGYVFGYGEGYGTLHDGFYQQCCFPTYLRGYRYGGCSSC